MLSHHLSGSQVAAGKKRKTGKEKEKENASNCFVVVIDALTTTTSGFFLAWSDGGGVRNKKERPIVCFCFHRLRNKTGSKQTNKLNDE